MSLRSLQSDLSAGEQKLTTIFVQRIVCRLPRKFGACVNSVYQVLFPPPHKCLRMRLAMHKRITTLGGNRELYFSVCVGAN